VGAKGIATRVFEVQMARAILAGSVVDRASFRAKHRTLTERIEPLLGKVSATNAFAPGRRSFFTGGGADAEARRVATRVLLAATKTLGFDDPEKLAAHLRSGLFAALYTSVPLPSGETAHLLEVNDDVQTTNYSCGPTALKTVLEFFGFAEAEEDLIAEMGTTPEQGTPPEAIAAAATRRGLAAEVKVGMTLADLERAVYPSGSKKPPIPVIIDIQAWREGDDLAKPWSRVWESGHYVVVIGMDEDHVYIEDPSIEGARGQIPRAELLDRWHDYEGDTLARGRKYVRCGIVIAGAPKDPAIQPID
jgi:predicted double-glycine peptidase